VNRGGTPKKKKQGSKGDQAGGKGLWQDGARKWGPTTCKVLWDSTGCTKTSGPVFYELETDRGSAGVSDTSHSVVGTGGKTKATRETTLGRGTPPPTPASPKRDFY